MTHTEAIALTWRTFLQMTVREMDTIDAMSLSDDEKLRQKRVIFESACEEFGRLGWCTAMTFWRDNLNSKHDFRKDISNDPTIHLHKLRS